MASWMVHLRIAQGVLNETSALSPTEFIVGNIAPDSGVPNADWSAFTPGTQVSHFKTPDKKADPDAFAQKYFRPEQQGSYTPGEFSFYLGYLTHLLTDVLWSEKIALPTLEKFGMTHSPQRREFIVEVKKDWYDLDFRYLRDNPGFPAFEIYRRAEGFANRYMEEFSEDAFDNRRQYITGFYLQGADGLDREYPYLTEEEMDAFVSDSCREILDILHTKYSTNL